VSGQACACEGTRRLKNLKDTAVCCIEVQYNPKWVMLEDCVNSLAYRFIILVYKCTVSIISFTDT
jgi:hypothetical protein